MLQKAELSCEADSENDLGGSPETMYFGDGSAESEAANRCLVLLESRDPRPRGHRCAMAHPDLINARSPERAKGHLCFSLDV